MTTPRIAADIVVLTIIKREPHVLLIERGIEPFKGALALPGGFMLENENLEDCARRELTEETGLDVTSLRQVRCYSETDRDPRGRVISVSFLATVRFEEAHVQSGSDASDARWMPLYDVLEPSEGGADLFSTHLAFDHQRILFDAVTHLRGIANYGQREEKVAEDIELLLKFLPDQFAIPEAADVMSAITGKPIQRANFRKWLLASGFVEPLDDLIPATSGTTSRGARATSMQRFKLARDLEPAAEASLRNELHLRHRLKPLRIAGKDRVAAALSLLGDAERREILDLIEKAQQNAEFILRCTSDSEVHVVDAETNKVVDTIPLLRRK